ASQAAPRATPAGEPPSPSDLGFAVDVTAELRVGDLVVHPRFGRCRVVREAADSKIKLRTASGGRFFDLHLRVARFARLPDEDGKRVFRLRIDKDVSGGRT
ncbi:MAG: hypothetical protein KC620_26260, partial [Myxococcales bacterium]|nr:hypothetical protein [Myxococcales bacterium]